MFLNSNYVFKTKKFVTLRRQQGYETNLEENSNITIK